MPEWIIPTQSNRDASRHAALPLLFPKLGGDVDRTTGCRDLRSGPRDIHASTSGGHATSTSKPSASSASSKGGRHPPRGLGPTSGLAPRPALDAPASSPNTARSYASGDPSPSLSATIGSGNVARNKSASKLKSPATRSSAAEWKAALRPSALSKGRLEPPRPGLLSPGRPGTN